jgi:hypothetical protein
VSAETNFRETFREFFPEEKQKPKVRRPGFRFFLRLTNPAFFLELRMVRLITQNVSKSLSSCPIRSPMYQRIRTPVKRTPILERSNALTALEAVKVKHSCTNSEVALLGAIVAKTTGDNN